MRSRRAIRAVAAIACALACAGSEDSRTQPQLFPAPPRDAITFWGHACVYIDVDGVGVVTDPVFERTLLGATAASRRRRRPRTRGPGSC